MLSLDITPVNDLFSYLGLVNASSLLTLFLLDVLHYANDFFSNLYLV